MNEPTSFQHRGYDLRCHARVVDGGRFAPTLVVSKQIWPTRPRAIEVPRGDYMTLQTAIEAAHAMGVEWVQNYG